MRYLLVLLLFFPYLWADEAGRIDNNATIMTEHNQTVKERPRIGLVLGGGGTKGAAHVGLIKFLEEKHIPIDAIAGTSVGSMIGGMYASGTPIEDIEQMMLTSDWREIIAFDIDRKSVPFRKKQLERDFPSNIKAGIDDENEVVLASGLFKRQNMMQFLKKRLRHVDDGISFDTLPIPFRAVATELRSGDKVVLKEGSLAQSIYASLCIPGGFEPITINGVTMVDGGLVDNLPVDVMREMDVDIIIVSNIGEPPTNKTKFKSYLDVMLQLSDFLTRKNIEDTLDNLKENEILINPDMRPFAMLELDKFAEVMEVGHIAGEEAYADGRITHLSLDEEAYADYQDALPKLRVKTPTVLAVKLENSTYYNDDAILEQLRIRVGEPLDLDALQEDIKQIYHMLVFEEVNYHIKKKEEGVEILITTTPRWDINGQVRFAFGFEDDFKGHSDYSVQFEYIMFGLNSYGAEWRNYFEVGREKQVMTELYLPLDSHQYTYFRPWLFYRDNKVYITPTLLGNHTIRADIDQSLPIHAIDHGVGGALGFNLGRSVRLEGGVIHKEVNPQGQYLDSELRLIYIDVNGTQYSDYKNETTLKELSAKQNIVKAFASFDVDTLDKAYFPHKGFLFHAGYEEQLPTWGSENDYQQMDIDTMFAFGNDVHSLLLHAKYGKTFDAGNLEESEDFNDYFSLGGLFNLSGLPTNSLTGDHMAFGSMNYRIRLSDNDFFGELSTPIYMGTSLEVGRAWYEHLNLNLAQEETFTAGSVYMGADTVLGPFYIGFGYAEGGYYNLYMMLGEKF